MTAARNMAEGARRCVRPTLQHERRQIPTGQIRKQKLSYEPQKAHFRPESRNCTRFRAGSTPRETRERLAGKRVLMYCTGGIRCERASALLSELSSSCANGVCPAQATQDAVAAAGPKEIVMVRGGVERYLRTFPDGGYWAGANYLFDRRFEQRPLKRQAPLGSCALCGVPCDLYRGRVVCAVATCKVPVLLPALPHEDAGRRPRGDGQVPPVPRQLRGRAANREARGSEGGAPRRRQGTAGAPAAPLRWDFTVHCRTRRGPRGLGH